MAGRWLISIKKLTTNTAKLAAKLATSLATAKAKVALLKATAPILLPTIAILLVIVFLTIMSIFIIYIAAAVIVPTIIVGIDDLYSQEDGIVPGEIICTPTKKFTAKDLDQKLEKVGGTSGVFKGKGSVFLSTSEKYGVDPILVIAIALHESAYGKASVAKNLNNPGAMMNPKTDKLMRFDSLDEGIDRMTSNLYRNYVVDGLTTPEKIGPKYAPVGALNDEKTQVNQFWVSSVNGLVEQLGGLTYKCERSVRGSESVQAMISEAYTLIGKTKYKLGGDSYPDLLDCSSFVMHLYKRHLGINLPRTTGEQVNVGKKIKKSELAPGDLVFFQNTYKDEVSHVGIYIGDNKFIHAANSNDNVIVSRLDDNYYKSKWHSARRVIVAAKYTDGKLVRPVNTKRISCHFTCYRNHNGIDFPAPIDTPVFAADSGKVITVEHLKGSYGSYIVIDHGGGLKTLYAHMYRYQVKVKVGDKVKRGQVIGAVGNQGNSTGPHLHFEVSLHGEHVNPEKYIK